MSLLNLDTGRLSGHIMLSNRLRSVYMYVFINIRVLIEGGADINLRDEDGYTALYWAQEYNYRRIVKLLKKHGATL